MDKIGRISSLKLSIVMFSIGWSLLAFAANAMMLFSGVFIIGVSVGKRLFFDKFFKSSAIRREKIKPRKFTKFVTKPIG